MRCWLSAVSPTSNSPVGEIPTQEGSILLWFGPSTRTRPSTYAATSELVVPRSIPTTRSLITCSGSFITHSAPWPPRHPDLRRAEQLAIPFVTHPVHGHHRSFFSVVRLFHIHGAHSPRIELPPFALDGLNLKLEQEIVQIPQAEAIALFEAANHVERMLPLPPSLPEDAVPEDRPQLRPAAHRFQAALEALPHFEEPAERFLAGTALGVGGQRLSHLFEGPALQADLLSECGHGRPHGVPVHGKRTGGKRTGGKTAGATRGAFRRRTGGKTAGATSGATRRVGKDLRGDARRRSFFGHGG